MPGALQNLFHTAGAAKTLSGTPAVGSDVACAGYDRVRVDWIYNPTGDETSFYVEPLISGNGTDYQNSCTIETPSTGDCAMNGQRLVVTRAAVRSSPAPYRGFFVVKSLGGAGIFNARVAKTGGSSPGALLLQATPY